MSSAAIDVLKRARLRIAGHGYDPGVSEPRQGRAPRHGFLGYSLREAMMGLGATNDAPIEAVRYLTESIAALHPETPTIDAFDASRPSKAAVQNVITRAINLAKLAPAPQPEPEEATESRAPQTFHPLDHDRDGQKGGSLPSSSRGLEALHAEAGALGLAVDRRWGLQRLLDEIAAAKAKREAPPLPELGPTPVAPEIAVPETIDFTRKGPVLRLTRGGKQDDKGA